MFCILFFVLSILSEISRINTTKYLKDQRRPSSRLATVTFRGTPCVLPTGALLRFVFKMHLSQGSDLSADKHTYIIKIACLLLHLVKVNIFIYPNLSYSILLYSILFTEDLVNFILFENRRCMVQGEAKPLKAMNCWELISQRQDLICLFSIPH